MLNCKSHSASVFPHFLFLSLLRGNKKKGIKSSIGRLFGKKEKSRLDQPLSKDGQMTPPVIPGSMKQTRIHYMRQMSCFYYYYRVLQSRLKSLKFSFIKFKAIKSLKYFKWYKKSLTCNQKVFGLFVLKSIKLDFWYHVSKWVKIVYALTNCILICCFTFTDFEMGIGDTMTLSKLGTQAERDRRMKKK